LGGMVSVEFAKSKLDIILAKNLGCLWSDLSLK
jgi:hypothetical protein